MHTRRLAVALATSVSTVLLAAPAIPASAAPPARFVVPEPPAGSAVVTVKTGADRAPGDTVTSLAGVTLGLYRDEADTTPVLQCVSDADGDCSFVVDEESGLLGTKPYVKQIAVPGGWFMNPNLRTGPGNGSGSIVTPYVFQVHGSGDSPIAAGSTYTSRSDFMRSNDNDLLTRSDGIWQQSRVNPPMPSQCGLDIALVLDLSASVGSDLPDLKAAADEFVDAFVGTPSSMAVFGFARYSPNVDATTGTVYPNHPELESISTQGGADSFKSLYANWGLGSGPNWDQALYRVAEAAPSYDAAIVLTDGNPTRWGIDTLHGDNTNTHFTDLEPAIFSANLVKSEGTRVISFGIGNGVEAETALNLAALSGPTKYNGSNAVTADYYQVPHFTSAGETLRELALSSCQRSVSVVKQIVPAGNTGEDITGARPAGGWQFDATGANGATVSPGSGTTAAGTGGVSFEVDFPEGSDTAGINIDEVQQPGYTLVTQGGDNAVCVDLSTNESVAVENSGETGFDLTVGLDSAVRCTVYNRAADVDVTVDKEWVVNGVTYAQGEQPDGLDATLTLSGPDRAPLSEQPWGVPRGGYDRGDAIQFDETTTITDETCVLDSSRVTERNGDAVVDGDLPFLDDLTETSNTYLVTNTVTCEEALPGGSLGSLDLGSLGLGSLGSLGLGSLGAGSLGSLEAGSLGAGSVGSLGSLGSLGALGSAGSAGSVIPPVIPPAPPVEPPAPEPPPSTTTPPPSTATPTPTPTPPPSTGPRPNAIDGGAAEQNTARNVGIAVAGLALLGLAAAGAVAVTRRRSS